MEDTSQVRWFTDPPTESIRRRIEDLVRRMGGSPVEAIAIETGDVVGPHFGRAGRALVLAEDAFFVVDYTPGGNKPERSASGEIPAWSLDATRVEWLNAPPLGVRAIAGGSQGTSISFSIGDDTLPSIYKDESAAREFSTLYVTRWTQARTTREYKQSAGDSAER